MSILLTIAGTGWLLFELGLIRRDRKRAMGSTDRDRGTRTGNFVLIVAAIVVAEVLGAAIGKHSPLLIPGARLGARLVIAGLLIIGLGLALRVWAVITLGRSFRTTVEVDPGQAVVTRGPYRRIRHPSYTGLLLIVIGFGLAYGNWPGLAVCVILPAVAIRRRIVAEEAELTRELGEPYIAYCRGTSRLVPGVW